MRRYPESAARSGFMVCASRAGAVDNAQFDSLWRTPRRFMVDSDLRLFQLNDRFLLALVTQFFEPFFTPQFV